MVIFWEGYIYIELIACCMANNLFFKARDELTGTENQWEVFAFAAFESNAFFEAFKVDQSGIAVLSSSFYVGQTRVSSLMRSSSAFTSAAMMVSTVFSALMPL